jgi:hypothetical protein
VQRAGGRWVALAAWVNRLIYGCRIVEEFADFSLRCDRLAVPSIFGRRGRFFSRCQEYTVESRRAQEDLLYIGQSSGEVSPPQSRPPVAPPLSWLSRWQSLCVRRSCHDERQSALSIHIRPLSQATDTRLLSSLNGFGGKVVAIPNIILHVEWSFHKLMAISTIDSV